MNRFVILTGVVLICLLANLSLRDSIPVAAQSTCLTETGPNTAPEIGIQTGTPGTYPIYNIFQNCRKD